MDKNRARCIKLLVHELICFQTVDRLLYHRGNLFSRNDELINLHDESY